MKKDKLDLYHCKYEYPYHLHRSCYCHHVFIDLLPFLSYSLSLLIFLMSWPRRLIISHALEEEELHGNNDVILEEGVGRGGWRSSSTGERKSKTNGRDRRCDTSSFSLVLEGHQLTSAEAEQVTRRSTRKWRRPPFRSRISRLPAPNTRAQPNPSPSFSHHHRRWSSSSSSLSSRQSSSREEAGTKKKENGKKKDGDGWKM